MSLPHVAHPSDLENGAGEIERIRAEYERRKRDIPQAFYSWERAANCFTHTQLVRDCVAELTRAKMFPLENRSIADIGCGAGTWLLEFAQWEATNLHGIDLDESRIERAKARFPSAELYAGDARQLPWSNDSFDLVSQFTLFTSILSDPVKKKIASEMIRVLKPGGVILWFDFRINNPRNKSVRGISASEIHSLFPDCSVRLRPVTLAPPLARRIVPISWIAAALLEKIPFLRTHYLGIIRKK
jgi:ubiquinone/menaquinone biosynthesis C-methylase UbiE